MAPVKKWTGKVKVKWHSPPGLFTKSAEEIAKVIAENSKSLKQTVSRIQFYATRAGIHIDAGGKAKIEKAKKLAHRYFPEKKKAKSTWKPRPARAPKKTVRRTSLPTSPKKRAKKIDRTSLAHSRASLAPSRPVQSRPYWFISEARKPAKWRRSRNHYSHVGKTSEHYVGEKAMPFLGTGSFHYWIIKADGRLAHVAQRA